MTRPTLTLRASAPCEIVRPLLPLVLIDGEARRDLLAADWTLAEAPDFGTLTLTRRPPADSPVPPALPKIGSRVVVRLGVGRGAQIFRGRIARHAWRMTDAGEVRAATCEHELSASLRGTLLGRHRLDDSASVFVPTDATRFNAGADGLASSEAVDLDDRAARVFDGSAAAERWTVAEALWYLLCAHCPGHLRFPGKEEIDARAAGLDLGAYDATGRTLLRALMDLAARAGLLIGSGRDGRTITLYGPGLEGRVRNVSLQPPGGTLDSRRTNLHRGTIELRRRPAARPIVALGGAKQYEATFPLKKGWNPDAETHRWRDTVRGLAEDWQATAEVYRLWVLNEHGGWCSDPYGLGLYDFADLEAGGEFLTRRPRRFLPCLSAGATGQSLGVVVEYRCDETAPWRRWTGPVWVHRDQCAVTLGGDALPADFHAAAMQDALEVRVTATVEADARLRVEIAGNPHLPREVIDLGDRARFRAVDPSSLFAGDAAPGEPDAADDSQLLALAARTAARAAGRAVEAKLALLGVDGQFGVGDLVERLDGRAIDLAGRGDRRAWITRVEHRFGDEQTTLLHLKG